MEVVGRDILVDFEIGGEAWERLGGCKVGEGLRIADFERPGDWVALDEVTFRDKREGGWLNDWVEDQQQW